MCTINKFGSVFDCMYQNLPGRFWYELGTYFRKHRMKKKEYQSKYNEDNANYLHTYVSAGFNKL